MTSLQREEVAKFLTLQGNKRQAAVGHVVGGRIKVEPLPLDWVRLGCEKFLTAVVESRGASFVPRALQSQNGC